MNQLICSTCTYYLFCTNIWEKGGSSRDGVSCTWQQMGIIIKEKKMTCKKSMRLAVNLSQSYQLFFKSIICVRKERDPLSFTKLMH